MAGWPRAGRSCPTPWPATAPSGTPCPEPPATTLVTPRPSPLAVGESGVPLHRLVAEATGAGNAATSVVAAMPCCPSARSPSSVHRLPHSRPPSQTRAWKKPCLFRLLVVAFISTRQNHPPLFHSQGGARNAAAPPSTGTRCPSANDRYADDVRARSDLASAAVGEHCAHGCNAVAHGHGCCVFA
eukprot:ctg_221.g87